MFEPYHGFPTLEADAALNVVVTSWTFLCAIEVQHPVRELLHGQITCKFKTEEITIH